MTTREPRGLRRLPLPALLLLPLLATPLFAMTGDDYGSPYSSPREIRAAQTVLQGDHYLKAGQYEVGRMDQGTIDAVRAFQRNHLIPSSGLLDRETVAQLVAHRPATAARPAQVASPAPATGNTGGVATTGTEGESGLRSMPATASPVPWMTAIGAVLMGGGLLLARRRRA